MKTRGQGDKEQGDDGDGFAWGDDDDVEMAGATAGDGELEQCIEPAGRAAAKGNETKARGKSEKSENPFMNRKYPVAVIFCLLGISFLVVATGGCSERAAPTTQKPIALWRISKDTIRVWTGGRAGDTLLYFQKLPGFDHDEFTLSITVEDTQHRVQTMIPGVICAGPSGYIDLGHLEVAHSGLNEHAEMDDSELDTLMGTAGFGKMRILVSLGDAPSAPRSPDEYKALSSEVSIKGYLSSHIGRDDPGERQ